MPLRFARSLLRGAPAIQRVRVIAALVPTQISLRLY
jgi:hypothetical protein